MAAAMNAEINPRRRETEFVEEDLRPGADDRQDAQIGH